MIIFLSINNTNIFAAELADQIKDKSKNIFKTLTRKSLNQQQLKIFLSNYVIIIDDKRGDGVVTYFFDEMVYKRYKDLNLISEDKWTLSKLGKLKIFTNDNKEIWKIQPAKQNTINIKKNFKRLGELYEFSYSNKTNFYLDLEEKKLNEAN